MLGSPGCRGPLSGSGSVRGQSAQVLLTFPTEQHSAGLKNCRTTTQHRPQDPQNHNTVQASRTANHNTVQASRTAEPQHTAQASRTADQQHSAGLKNLITTTQCRPHEPQNHNTVQASRTAEPQHSAGLKNHRTKTQRRLHPLIIPPNDVDLYQ